MFMTIRDPWTDFHRLTRDIERSLFGGGTTRANRSTNGGAARRGDTRLPMQLSSDDKNFYATFLMPGVDPANLELTLTDNVLSVRGELPTAELPEGARVLRNERPTGRFERAIELPVPVNGEAIEANFRDGVLAITLPKHESVRPRAIPISVN